MINIAKAYDEVNCPADQEKCIIYENTTPDKAWTKVKFSASIGIQQMQYETSSVLHFENTVIKKTLPCISVEMFVYNPRVTESFGIFLNLTLSSKMNQEKQYEKRTLKFEGTPFSIKVGARYTFIKSKFSPSIELAPVYTNIMKGKYTLFYGNPNLPESIKPEDYKMRRQNWGASLGIGLNYTIYKKQDIFMRFNYDFYLDADRTQENGDDQLKLWQLKLGYTF